MTSAAYIRERLNYLRGEIMAERISTEEILELQGLRDEIEPEDVVLLEWAGVPEHHDEDCVNAGLFGETECLECRQTRARR